MLAAALVLSATLVTMASRGRQWDVTSSPGDTLRTLSHLMATDAFTTVIIKRQLLLVFNEARG